MFVWYVFFHAITFNLCDYTSDANSDEHVIGICFL